MPALSLPMWSLWSLLTSGWDKHINPAGLASYSRYCRWPIFYIDTAGDLCFILIQVMLQILQVTDVFSDLWFKQFDSILFFIICVCIDTLTKCKDTCCIHSMNECIIRSGQLTNRVTIYSNEWCNWSFSLKYLNFQCMI